MALGTDGTTGLPDSQTAIMRGTNFTVPQSRPYAVVTDASVTAAGGVLMQDHGNGLQPLAFISRASNHQNNDILPMNANWLPSNFVYFSGDTT